MLSEKNGKNTEIYKGKHPPLSKDNYFLWEEGYHTCCLITCFFYLAIYCEKSPESVCTFPYNILTQKCTYCTSSK